MHNGTAVELLFCPPTQNQRSREVHVLNFHIHTNIRLTTRKGRNSPAAMPTGYMHSARLFMCMWKWDALGIRVEVQSNRNGHRTCWSRQVLSCRPTGSVRFVKRMPLDVCQVCRSASRLPEALSARSPTPAASYMQGLLVRIKRGAEFSLLADRPLVRPELRPIPRGVRVVQQIENPHSSH